MAFGDSYLSVMLSTDYFGVPVVCGGVTTSGILDTHDVADAALNAAGYFTHKLRVLTIQTGTLPALAKEVAIKVNGTSYKVDDYLVEADGSLTRVWVTVP